MTGPSSERALILSLESQYCEKQASIACMGLSFSDLFLWRYCVISIGKTNSPVAHKPCQYLWLQSVFIEASERRGSAFTG